jgi:hypothetical protein
MQLKYGKYKGLDLSELIGQSTEKYSYFKWLLNHNKTPSNVKEIMREMDNPSNFWVVDKWRKLHPQLKQFWINGRNGFLGYLENEKYKQYETNQKKSLL